MWITTTLSLQFLLAFVQWDLPAITATSTDAKQEHAPTGMLLLKWCTDSYFDSFKNTLLISRIFTHQWTSQQITKFDLLVKGGFNILSFFFKCTTYIEYRLLYLLKVSILWRVLVFLLTACESACHFCLVIFYSWIPNFLPTTSSALGRSCSLCKMNRCCSRA